MRLLIAVLLNAMWLLEPRAAYVAALVGFLVAEVDDAANA